jgi:microcystin-dependent protein
MAVVNTSRTFTNNEQITSTKLNQIMDESSFISDAIVPNQGLQITAGGQMQIPNSGITTALIGNNQVTNSKIANSAITTAKLTSEIANSLVPSGAVMVFAMNGAPSGWLAANGSNVSRTTYANLFTAIGTTYGSGNGSTTFTLPDLRGYFVRGSGTNSDGAASGGFGEKQADSFANHNHTINSGQQNGISSGCGADNTYQKANDYACGLGTTGSSGGTETRPKNIAMLYCIKI